MDKAVLIVDDDRKLRDLLTEYLTPYGFRVSTLPDGMEIVKAIRTTRPDIIILDIMMPKKDGLEVLKEIRMDSAVPVIMLTARGEDARAMVHRPEQARLVTEAGAREVVVGDMSDPATMEQATHRVRAVYHIPPNVSPHEVEMGVAVIQAARSAGVAHFCYHSVLHPQTEEMPHHWKKLRVEEQLLRSGLPFTIMQPTIYMQNLLSQREQVVRKGRYQIPYSAETRLSYVDLEDVAEAAVIVLTEPGHLGATYELVGTRAVTQIEVAWDLSQALGRPVRVEVIPRDFWQEQARAGGLGDYQVDALIKMFEYYERYGFDGSSGVLAWLLGRPPRTLRDLTSRLIDDSFPDSD